ncbi:isochorismatase family protein [Piscinibacter koreensis]|uniref:Isochorismatase family protein n=1 Tax=Piscinibacter koreensis TaxID=2742824 RepID=A0A7Y6TWL0_9BURK|nr:isochorismatase family protein [Schlegelella koreensis]NUZ06229.1 isochorismatase family protein [Schlegelella koreensis]
MSALCQADRCTLLIVDPQARLMPAIHEGAAVLHRCRQLALAARELGIHVIGTEQNPDGLGPMVDELRKLCDTVLWKMHFAATAEPGFLQRLPHGRDTLVVAGCEAHVCVMQTVAGLLDAGYRVKWVIDAVGSRHAYNRDAAAARVRELGADLVTTEMVIFEWLATSEHPKFRTLSALIR